jgi:hypothetical protein
MGSYEREHSIEPSKYPEHEKLRPIQPYSQKIGDFLEWLGQEGYHLAKYENERLWPSHESISSLLARFFEIDQDKLEQEKLAMIDELRRANTPA